MVERHVARRQAASNSDLVEGRTRSRRSERWRERAAVGAMLELIRSDYEQHRQPETLHRGVKVPRAAHAWPLHAGLDSRWPRTISCWSTTADGESLPVENLSRGAREQLFLSVRLALVAMYARRGVQLPMILDDVLVNFDDGRARLAAEVLTDFAKEGHQLMVFTCHEHVWSMFKELLADVRRLPTRDAVEEAIEEVEVPIVEEFPEEVAEEAALEEPPIEVVEEILEEVAVERPKKKRRKRRPEPAPVEAEYEAITPKVEETIEIVYETVPTTATNRVEEWVEVAYERPYGEPISSASETRYESFTFPRKEDDVSWLDEAEQAWGEPAPVKPAR